MTIRPKVVWQLEAQLGEGPVWLPQEQALRFVDIKRGHLHRYVPATGEQETLRVGAMPSFIVPAADGNLLVGSGDGVFRLESGGLGARLCTLPQPAHNRTNDATVDCNGRLWLGTMDNDEARRTGAVWCFADGKVNRAGPEAVVTNGPATSGDGRWLYHVDSGERTIWRFALTGAPHLENGEVFLQLGEADGYPDGIVTDSEGCLWVALWDGWGLRRYSPGGDLLLHIAMPCARVTKLAFGGTDLATAYVTTARTGLNEAQLAGQPDAGSLFAFRAPVAGLPTFAVRLG